MPKNSIGKTKDGFATYRVVRNKREIRITQRKTERLKDFKERCNQLDGLNVDASAMTFNEAYQAWITSHVMPNCSKAYHEQIKVMNKTYVLPSIGFRKLTDIIPSDVTKMLVSMSNAGKAEWTMRHARKIVSSVFRWTAMQNGWTDLTSPTSQTVIPNKKRYAVVNKDNKDEKESAEKAQEYNRDDGVRFVTNEEMERFKKAMDRNGACHYKYAFLLYPLTGLRRGELLGLLWTDITSDNNLRVSRAVTRHGLTDLKTRQKAFRYIPLSEESKAVLEAQKAYLQRIGLQDSKYIFPTTHGNATTVTAIVSAFNRVIKQSTEWEVVKGKNNRSKNGKVTVQPLDFSIQDFRSTFGTKAAQYMPMHVLAEVMGHTSIKTTERYYVGAPKELLEIARKGMGEMSKNGLTKQE